MISSDANPDTRLIADLLMATPFGEQVTLNHISAAIDRDILPVRYLIYAGMRLALSECGAVFASIRGIGYRRLTNEEIHTIGQTTRSRIRSTSRNGLRAIAQSASFANNMPPDHQRRINQEITSLAMIQQLARDKYLPKLAVGATSPLSLAASARAFMEAVGAKAIPAPEAKP